MRVCFCLGINAIIFYAPKIFEDAGLSHTLELTFGVVVSVLYCLYVRIFHVLCPCFPVSVYMCVFPASICLISFDCLVLTSNVNCVLYNHVCVYNRVHGI